MLAIVSVAINSLAVLDLTCVFLTQALFFRHGLSHMQVQGPLTACYSFLRGSAGVAAEAGTKAAAERAPGLAVVASSGGAPPVGSTGGPADSVGVMAIGAEEPAAGASMWWANQANTSEADVGSHVTVALSPAAVAEAMALDATPGEAGLGISASAAPTSSPGYYDYWLGYPKP